MDHVVGILLRAQLPDGYLGTYLDKDRWTSWDVWVHKYNLIGLLAYWDISGDGRALAAARRIGDLLAETFGDTPGKRDIIASSTHVGMAATSVLEPMCQLFRITGDRKYLDFAEYLVRSWEQPNGPRLVSSLLSIGRVDRTANGKAYEMMSDLVGLLELHRLTGNPQYRKVAEIAWNDIARRRLYITGTTSAHEHFQPDGVLPGDEANDVGEGCATVTWLQLTWHLLRLSGEAKYGEELEKTVYNQLLAAQNPRNGDICYFTPLNGKKNPTRGVNCCVSSEPRGIALIPQLAWGAMRGGLAINFYNGGVINTVLPGAGKVRVQVLTDYPASGDAAILVEPEKPARWPLYLRVPAWTKRFEIDPEDKGPHGTPGEWMKIEREWKPDSKLLVKIEMTVRAVDGGVSYPDHVALLRGPQVLALDRSVNEVDAVPFLFRAALADPRSPALVETDFGYALAGFAANLTGRRRRVALEFVPFADAADYRVWLPIPSKLKTSRVPLSAFRQESLSSRDESVHGSIADERVDTWRSTRRAQDAARRDDWFAVEWTIPAPAYRVEFVHGAITPEGGAFAAAPMVQIKREKLGAWVDVGPLSAYRSPQSGGKFSLDLPKSEEIVGIRVLGKPAGTYTSCAELSVW
jgi:DUF1680 family protein